MKIINEIKSIAAKKSITLTAIAQELTNRTGRKYTINGLSRKLRENIVRYCELEIIADILDYEVTLTEKK